LDISDILPIDPDVFHIYNFSWFDDFAEKWYENAQSWEVDTAADWEAALIADFWTPRFDYWYNPSEFDQQRAFNAKRLSIPLLKLSPSLFSSNKTLVPSCH